MPVAPPPLVAHLQLIPLLSPFIRPLTACDFSNIENTARPGYRPAHLAVLLPFESYQLHGYSHLASIHCRSVQANLGTLRFHPASATPSHATPRQTVPTMVSATPPPLLASARLATQAPTVPSQQACATPLQQPLIAVQLAATRQRSAAAQALSTAMAHAALLVRVMLQGSLVMPRSMLAFASPLLFTAQFKISPRLALDAR